MSLDLVTSHFEVIAILVLLNNCKKLYEDKQVKGISVLSPLFYLSWSVWNLFYYYSLNQKFSFICGIGSVVANLVWISLMMYYIVRRKREP